MVPFQICIIQKRWGKQACFWRNDSWKYRCQIAAIKLDKWTLVKGKKFNGGFCVLLELRACKTPKKLVNHAAVSCAPSLEDGEWQPTGSYQTHCSAATSARLRSQKYACILFPHVRGCSNMTFKAIRSIHSESLFKTFSLRKEANKALLYICYIAHWPTVYEYFKLLVQSINNYLIYCRYPSQKNDASAPAPKGLSYITPNH